MVLRLLGMVLLWVQRLSLLNLVKVLDPGHVSIGVTERWLSLPRLGSKGFDPAWWVPGGQLRGGKPIAGCEAGLCVPWLCVGEDLIEQ